MKLDQLARDVLHGDVPEPVHDRGRERMLAALASPASTRRFASTSRWARFAMLAACLAAIVGAWLAWPRPVLTFVIEGGAVAQSDAGETHISASNDDSVARFSDGSTVRFAPRSSGRIDGLSARGARIVLTKGQVHLAIVPGGALSAARDWSVEAGPHVVRVTGTEFDVSWDPAASRFRVTMQQGSVRVEGPVAPSGVALEAGSSLEVGPDGVMHIDRAGGEPSLAAAQAQPSTVDAAPQAELPPAAAASVVASGSATESAAAASSAGAPAAVAASARPRAAEASWAQLVAAGNYKEVVSAAQARGLDAVAASASLGDLIALADAARYEKDAAAARASLEAQRKRFGSTQAGRSATFVLGRMAEDSEGNVARAITLYDEYLATGGPFSAEALGRKMLAVRRSRGDAAARPIAAAYLESYPKGSYASAARTIVEAP